MTPARNSLVGHPRHVAINSARTALISGMRALASDSAERDGREPFKAS
jgi:hypothetical protein